MKEKAEESVAAGGGFIERRSTKVMSYRADVYRVMIASPSDVSTERQITRGVIHEWNSVHSVDRSMVLMPIGWETHASPDMGDRAQAIINRTVLADCDLLVAMFWTRLGSPTREAPSGTVEEIEEHLAAGKPAMLYFSSAPVRPESINREQYEALIAFKNSCKQRGLVEEYENLTEFREKFARQLAQTVIRNFLPSDSNLIVGPPLPVKIVPAISNDAQKLLSEAVKDPHGRIVRMETMGGLYLQTNGREFVEQRTPREEARWEAVLKELETQQLIESVSYKREVFQVANEGYRVADLLANR